MSLEPLRAFRVPLGIGFLLTADAFGAGGVFLLAGVRDSSCNAVLRRSRPFAHCQFAGAIDVDCVVDGRDPVRRYVVMLSRGVLRQLDEVLATFQMVYHRELFSFGTHDWHVWLD